ncbi:MAG TPA: hypothetical protein VGK73_04110 [Polyangiaceae bacterium]
MFVIPAICFVGGLMAMGRTKPQTTHRKLICLGPRSGIVYQVEEFPEIGTLVVRAPASRAIAQFIRASVREPGKPGLIWQNGQGDKELLELMRGDFAIAPKLAAVAADAEAPKPAAAAPSVAPKSPAPAASRPKAVPSSKAYTPSGI